MLHSIAGGDPDILARLRDYVNNPEDKVADRWQYLRCAERDAWAAVGLLLPRKTLERRFREGELDAWVALTLFGDDIRNGVESLSRSYGSLEFPVEPKGFGAFALQELRAARLAGELYAEQLGGINAGDNMERLAARLADQFPLLAQVVRHPELDVATMAWFFLDFRLRTNFETVMALPGGRTPPSNVGLSDVGILFVNCPTTVEEFVSDVYAQAEMTRRVRLTNLRMRHRDDLEADARAEVEAMLGRAVPLQASTLAEAVAEAEQIRMTGRLVVAQNSIWAWYNALPMAAREAIGHFEDKHRLWTAVRRSQ